MAFPEGGVTSPGMRVMTGWHGWTSRWCPIVQAIG